MANPTPWLPPLLDEMAVLMPITSPSQVHQRTAAVARIDRGIGLQEVLARRDARRRASGADDAGRDRALQAERLAQGEHPVADLHGSLSPSFAVQAFAPSIRTIAKSVWGPSFDAAVNSRPSERRTTTFPPLTTWLLVRITPEGSMITPEPIPLHSIGCMGTPSMPNPCPGNCRKKSSKGVPSNGFSPSPALGRRCPRSAIGVLATSAVV